MPQTTHDTMDDVTPLDAVCHSLSKRDEGCRKLTMPQTTQNTIDDGSPVDAACHGLSQRVEGCSQMRIKHALHHPPADLKSTLGLLFCC